MKRALVVLLAAVVFVPAAGAEPSWQPAVVVAYGAHPSELFAWGDGGATTLWTSSGSQALYEVVAASRPGFGGVWSTARLGQTNGSWTAGANRVGDVVVAWWSGNQLVLSTRNPQTGGWSHQQLTAWMLQNGKSYGGAGYPLLDPATIAVGPRGDVVAAWDTAVACDAYCYYRVHAAVRAAGSASWDPDTEIAPEENRNSFQERVAIDAAGDALLVWVYQPIPGSPVIRAAFRPAGAAWQTPVDLVTLDLNAAVYGLSLAMDAAGDAVLAWSVLVPESSTGVFVSYRRVGGAWSTPTKLADVVERPDALIDDGGNALVAWPGPREQLYAARYSAASAGWSSPTLVSPQAFLSRSRRTGTRLRCGTMDQRWRPRSALRGQQSGAI